MLLADALGQPRELFYMDGQRVSAARDEYHYRKPDVGVKTLRQVDARIDLAALRLDWLLDFGGAEVEAPHTIPRIDLDEQTDAVSAAQEVRRQWKIPDGPIHNLGALIEDAGVFIVWFSFGDTKIDGLSCTPPKMKDLIFINPCTPGDRQNWTLAHELGHRVMHRKPEPERENQADAFAAELLMPAKTIKGELRIRSFHDLEALKARWHVSIAALLRRARTLETISQTEYTKYFIYMSKNRMRINEPIHIDKYEPTLLKSLFDVYCDELSYSLDEILMAMKATKPMFDDEYSAWAGNRFNSKARIRTRLEVVQGHRTSPVGEEEQASMP